MEKTKENQLATNVWRICSTCKKEIYFGQIYQSCSVSTCKKWTYCSVDCWEIHVPLLKHKNAWAEEERAPRQLSSPEKETSPSPRRRIIVTTTSSEEEQNKEVEILIVASKLKQFVKEKSDLNTSSSVMKPLSDLIRKLTLRAIENAKIDGRKTLMDRDFNNIL